MTTKIEQKTRKGIRFYHPDHLGSTTVVTDLDGEVTQNVAYIPYGEVFVEQRNGTWNTPYLFNAKELDEETGLYYYEARYLDPTGTRWLSVDPLFEKYVGMTPYGYCAGNPVKLVDPDGREVKPNGENELEMIRNTVPVEDRKHIQLDKNGYINKRKINKHKSNSGNYNKLKELVNSDYEIHVTQSDKFKYKDESGVVKEDGHLSYIPYNDNYPEDKDINFEYVNGLTTGEQGNTGKTLFPDLEGMQNSPDEKIRVYIHNELSSTGAAETFSHEVYGHVLLYHRNGGNHVKSGHIIVNMVETNELLKQMIFESRKETVKNMNR